MGSGEEMIMRPFRGTTLAVLCHAGTYDHGRIPESPKSNRCPGATFYRI